MDLQLPLDYAAIERILPHRYPFLLVDRITEFEPDKRIVGIKNVSAERALPRPLARASRRCCRRRSSPRPSARSGAILILAKPENRDKLIFFMGMERVRYKRPVAPGRRRRDRGDGAAPAQPDGRAARRGARERHASS